MKFKTLFLLTTVSAFFLVKASVAQVTIDIDYGNDQTKINPIPLESILNLFIQEHSATRLEWQTDMEIVQDPANISNGRFIGKSEQINAYYTYRPVTFAELSSLGRKELYNDPRLLPWIEWFSGKQRLAPRITASPQPIISDRVISPLPKVYEEVIPEKSEKPVQSLTPLEKKYLYTVPAHQVKSPSSLHIQLSND